MIVSLLTFQFLIFEQVMVDTTLTCIITDHPCLCITIMAILACMEEWIRTAGGQGVTQNSGE